MRFTPPRLSYIHPEWKAPRWDPSLDSLPDSSSQACSSRLHLRVGLACGCRHGEGCTSFPGKEIRPPPPLRGDPPGVGFTGGFDGIIRKAVLQNTSPGNSKLCAVCDHLQLCTTHQLPPSWPRRESGAGDLERTGQVKDEITAKKTTLIKPLKKGDWRLSLFPGFWHERVLSVSPPTPRSFLLSATWAGSRAHVKERVWHSNWSSANPGRGSPVTFGRAHQPALCA